MSLRYVTSPDNQTIGDEAMTKTKEKILALLENLGKTKEEVAAKLVSLGIKGEQKKCYSCPITQYLINNGVALLATIALDFVFGLAGVAVAVAFGGGVYWFPISKYPQLQGVRDFILAFDRGEF